MLLPTMARCVQDGFSDQKLSEELLTVATEEARGLAERAVSENALTRSRVDKLRDEILGALADETDKRVDSVAALRTALAASMKDQQADLACVTKQMQVRNRAWA